MIDILVDFFELIFGKIIIVFSIKILHNMISYRDLENLGRGK